MRPSLPQDITYWAPGAEDRFGGKTYSSPITIKGRWEDKAEQVRTQTNQQIVSRSKFYTEHAIQYSGYVKLGVDTGVNPLEVADAEEIRVVGSSPDLSTLSRIYTGWI